MAVKEGDGNTAEAGNAPINAWRYSAKAMFTLSYDQADFSAYAWLCLFGIGS